MGVSVKSHRCIVWRSTSGHCGGRGLPGGWQQRGHPGVAGPGLAAGACPTALAPAIAHLHQEKGWARAGLGHWPVGGPGSVGAMAGQGRAGTGRGAAEDQPWWGITGAGTDGPGG